MRWSFSPLKSYDYIKNAFFTIDGILKQRKYGDDKNYWPSGPNSAVVTVPQVPEFQGRYRFYHNIVDTTKVGRCPYPCLNQRGEPSHGFYKVHISW